MLIKEISEDLAVIIINNNKVPNFPLKKALWKVWNQFLGQLQPLQNSQLWRSSAGPPALAAHITIVDYFLDGTSCRLDFGLPSPHGSPLEGDVSRGKHILASVFQQPRALPDVGIELPAAFLSYLGSNVGCETVTFKRPSQIPPCLQLLQQCHGFPVFLYHVHPPLTGISDFMHCLQCLCVGTWIAPLVCCMTLSLAVPSPGHLWVYQHKSTP